MLNTHIGYQMALIGVTVLSVVLLVATCMFFRKRRRWVLSLQAEHDRLDEVFEASPVGMVMLNDRMDIVRLNSAAAQMAKGEPATVWIDKRPGDLMQCSHRSVDARGCGEGDECWLCPMRKVIDSVIGDGLSVRRVEAPMVLVCEGGVKTVWLRMGARPFQFQGRRHVIVAVDDITENKKSEEKLEEATLELERLNAEIQCANAAKGQFLANMSHEIRTPLNGIIGMTGLLTGTAMSDEQREYVETIYASGEALLVVVNDILDFSKIEADKMVLENESFDLQKCVEEAVRLVTPAATKKKLELICQMDDTLPPLWIGDGGRLRQVLVNLLTNSIKFTERGEIVVACAGQKQDNGTYQLDFSVRDTGVGIPPAQQAKLFQSFSQVDAAAARCGGGGTGLGLAISKRLCEMMGGGLSVESKGIPGQGAVLRFSIKVQRETEARNAAFGKPHDSLAGKRLLIVDDNQTSREQLKRQAEMWRMAATAVASGKAALDCLGKSEPFEVALLDYTMPDMNGLKLADEIRKCPGGGKLPLVLLSPLGGRVTEGDRTRVDVCLCKPAFSAHLQEALAALFDGHPATPTGNDAHVQMPLDGEMARLHPLKILLAEDNVVNQKVVVRLLEKLGYSADVTADGNEVVDAVKQSRYDLVLMDVQMPGLDGEQATIRIRRELPPERQPWIVATTANVMKGDRERYLSDGMDDYIPKPIRVEHLADVLRTVQPLAERAAQQVAKRV